MTDRTTTIQKRQPITDPAQLPSAAAGSLRAFLDSGEVKRMFAKVLGDNANAFIGSLAVLVYGSPHLKGCDPNSLVVSGLKAAALGLSIDPALGEAYIVPRNLKGVKTAQFQIGWRGLVQLALRTGQYVILNVGPVNEGVIRGRNPITGEMITGEQTSDKVAGYVAFLRLRSGFEKMEYMTVAELDAHRDRYAKGIDREDSAWKTSPDDMRRKTVLRRLLNRWGIKSAAMRKAEEDIAEVESAMAPASDDTLADAAEGMTSPEASAGSVTPTDYTNAAQVSAEIDAEAARAKMWGEAE